MVSRVEIKYKVNRNLALTNSVFFLFFPNKKKSLNILRSVAIRGLLIAFPVL